MRKGENKVTERERERVKDREGVRERERERERGWGGGVRDIMGEHSRLKQLNIY